MNRRTFLVAAAAGLAGACATSSRPAAVPIIDTHTHFYDPARPAGVPWPPKNDAVLYRTVLPAELQTIAEPLGIKGTVVVEASPWVEDNAWVLELAARNHFIVGLVGHLKPGTAGFAADLKRFGAHHLFRGLRTGGWDIPVSPGNSDFIRDLGLLAQRDLSLDILGGPDQLHQIEQVAALLPDLRIIINHCAGVRIDGGAPDPKWVEGIRKVAAHPRVSMKVSALAEGTGREFSAPKETEFYRPTLDLLWHEFGEDRLIFGSNWPVSARFADYPTVLRIVQPYFQARGRVAEEKYFHRNAQRVYGVRVS